MRVHIDERFEEARRAPPCRVHQSMSRFELSLHAADEKRLATVAGAGAQGMLEKPGFERDGGARPRSVAMSHIVAPKSEAAWLAKASFAGRIHRRRKRGK